MPHARTILALMAVTLTAPGSAADESGTRDCFITVRVRQVLLREPALAPLNLGVSVREGVATLYGSVPYAALARLAREKVSKVQGVLEVRTELEVRAPDDPLSEFLRPVPNAFVPDFLSHERYPPPGWLTSRWSDGEPASPSPSGISLMPPVTLRLPVPAPRREKSDLAQSVERLRRQDARFRGLRAEVRNGIVRLAGIAQRREDAMAFAQQISRLPGVGRVIIQEVRTPNDP